MCTLLIFMYVAILSLRNQTSLLLQRRRHKPCSTCQTELSEVVRSHNNAATQTGCCCTAPSCKTPQKSQCERTHGTCMKSPQKGCHASHVGYENTSTHLIQSSRPNVPALAMLLNCLIDNSLHGDNSACTTCCCPVVDCFWIHLAGTVFTA